MKRIVAGALSLWILTGCGASAKPAASSTSPPSKPGGRGAPPPGSSLAPNADVNAADPHAADLNRALRHRYRQ